MNKVKELNAELTDMVMALKGQSQVNSQFVLQLFLKRLDHISLSLLKEYPVTVKMLIEVTVAFLVPIAVTILEIFLKHEGF
jgi:hypothetical protein